MRRRVARRWGCRRVRKEASVSVEMRVRVRRVQEKNGEGEFATLGAQGGPDAGNICKSLKGNIKNDAQVLSYLFL